MAVSVSTASTFAAIEWQQTDCPMCGSGRWSTILRAPDPEGCEAGRDFRVVRCLECGLCFTNPRPGPADMGRFYSGDYLPHQLPQNARPAARPRRWPRRRWLRGLVGLDDHRLERGDLPRLGRRRLLDFGCGGGAFLMRMHDLGWQVLGLDASETAVRRIRRQLGLDAWAGTLPHPDLLPEGFDVITMWHSLEHVHRPLEVLEEAHRLLAPGGMLIVGVPNIDGAARRWFGPAWYGLDLPRHLTHFSPATLSAMLRRAGFEVRQIQMVRHHSWLRTSAQRAGRWPWLAIRPLCRLVALYCLLTGQCDCITATAVK